MIVNGETSDPVQVISGVPQCSVLSPLLFLTCIYIDGITSVRLSEGTKLYVDNMLLYKTIFSADYDYVE